MTIYLDDICNMSNCTLDMLLNDNPHAVELIDF